MTLTNQKSRDSGDKIFQAKKSAGTVKKFSFFGVAGDAIQRSKSFLMKSMGVKQSINTSHSAGQHSSQLLAVGCVPSSSGVRRECGPMELRGRQLLSKLREIADTRGDKGDRLEAVPVPRPLTAESGIERAPANFSDKSVAIAVVSEHRRPISFNASDLRGALKEAVTVMADAFVGNQIQTLISQLLKQLSRCYLLNLNRRVSCRALCRAQV